METRRKNSAIPQGASLCETIDQAAHLTALVAGRRLFECGHFSFAPLSAAKALPPNEALEVVSLEEARRLLPGTLLGESRALSAVFWVEERVQRLRTGLRSHLAHLALTELNHIQSEPTTAGLAAACLGYLDALPVADARISARVTALWQERFARALAAQHGVPLDFDSLLSPIDRADLGGVVISLASSVEGLLHCLSHFGERRLLQTPPPPPVSAQEDLEEYEGLLAARAHFLTSTLELRRAADLAGAHHALLQGDVANACLVIDERVSCAEDAATELARLEKKSGLHVLRERNLVLENFHYVRALSRQLQLLGSDGSDARALEKALFAYANEHATGASELLDDEIARLTPRLSRDTISTARVRVRHDDPSYPLSVASREDVVRAAQAGQDAQAGQTEATAARPVSSPSSSGASS